MASKQSSVLQGTLNLLVLQALAMRGSLHGYAIATLIFTASQENLKIEEGSLYPALHRMEQDGWISAAWGTSELGRRARFYEITAAGQRQLDAEKEHWLAITNAVNHVLQWA